MDLPEFLTRDAYGEIHLEGHRINLYQIVQFFDRGDSPRMLLGQFPTLDLPVIEKVHGFREANRAEVDAYVAAYRADLDRQRAEAVPQGPSWAELRRRMAMREGVK